MSKYPALERRAKGPARNLTAVWDRLSPLPQASENREFAERVRMFCQRKGITTAALEALGTRVSVRGRGPDLELAWATRAADDERVTAIKYRRLPGGERRAEPGSVFLAPAIIGARQSLDWFVAEGETDAARLFDLVGDVAAIMVLPAGALSFEREWAAIVPRGATAYLAHDADKAGDAGARRAASILGGRTVRLRPAAGSDWCEWRGEREDFVRLVQEARARASARVRTFDEVLHDYATERSGPALEPVRLGFGSVDAEIRGVSSGQVCGVAARTAVGKTWVLTSVLHTFSAQRDAGALVLSLEMPDVEWVERQLGVSADVAPEQVEAWARQGQLGEQAKEFLDRMRHVLLIDEALALADLPGALSEARDRLTVPLRLVLIDYLGLLGADGRDAYERASALGKGLKQFAKAEQVAVVVAMQVSRAGGDGSEPVTLSMLRDSGVLEESVDFLLGCWRPGRAQNLPPEHAAALRDVVRVAVLKNRKGPDGRVVDLRFRPASRRVYQPAEVTQ